MCIFVGELRQQQDHRYMLMKSNMIASKLGEDRSPVTKESVLEGNRKLNDLVGGRFGQDVRAAQVRSSNPKCHPEWGWHVPCVPKHGPIH